MNEGVLLLKEVAKLKDIVSLGVCVSIFQTCNGKQFKNMPASDFFCFLNLKLPKEKVTTLPGEKQRICYMIYVVSQTIVPADFAKTWIEGILDLCGISYEYYDKHRKDVVSINTSKNNREFKEIIQEAQERST